MPLKNLEIFGLRGFETKQTIQFACPNGNEGSGLTVLVGANNAGKSTVIEAVRALSQQQGRKPSFTQGRRNIKAGDLVELRFVDDLGNVTELSSVSSGSSETEFKSSNVDISKILVLPSRRTFEPYFGKSETTRSKYMVQIGFPSARTASLNQFTNRLFSAQKNMDKFNEVLARVLTPLPDWTIDQHDTGQYFLKFRVENSSHSSEGLGEGLVSLFFIIDALYDSESGQTIVIDEPELSLHPALQKKLAALFVDYTKDRQIILSTHSPYFVDLNALKNGATIARTHLINRASCISQLSKKAAASIAGLLTDLNNPHVLGLNAQEVFFLEDNVILVEGQEDVIFFEKIQSQLQITLQGSFFGWGVGGADKMERIANILKELGFKKVVGILDGDKSHLIPELKTAFPEFCFLSIPANDVRTKKARTATLRKVGLLDDSNNQIRPEYISQTRQIFESINHFLIETN